MVSVGYFLSCEEFGPHELVWLARLAEPAGFERLWISDHHHPWLREQGQSPFVWSVIGVLSQVTSLPISTAVTCPTIRIHPAIIAQAAATASVQCQGRFVLGVGTGEALNEHILAGRWRACAGRCCARRSSDPRAARRTGRRAACRGDRRRVLLCDAQQ
ncbi:MAG: LLM class flavin-dependent oxidoreductase [Pseudonocardiaceae bacterium]